MSIGMTVLFSPYDMYFYGFLPREQEKSRQRAREQEQTIKNMFVCPFLSWQECDCDWSRQSSNAVPGVTGLSASSNPMYAFIPHVILSPSLFSPPRQWTLDRCIRANALFTTAEDFLGMTMIKYIIIVLLLFRCQRVTLRRHDCFFLRTLTAPYPFTDSVKRKTFIKM